MSTTTPTITQDSRLTPQDSNPLTPESLAQTLLRTGHGLEQLMETLATDAEQISETLYSDEFQDHVRLRVDLAIAHARLKAAEALPACTAKLLRLTDADKPEVARRSLMAVMGMTGLATRVAPAPVRTASASDNATEKHPYNPDDPADRERFDDEARELTAIHANYLFLKDRGIDLLKLRDENFDGFVQHIEAFFKPAGVKFSGPFDDPVGPDHDLDEPETCARAHAFFNQKAAQQSAENPSHATPANITKTTVIPAPNPSRHQPSS